MNAEAQKLMNAERERHSFSANEIGVTVIEDTLDSMSTSR